MSDDRVHFGDIAVGMSWETGGITVTESHILAFAGLSGDFYDIHVDDDYARSLGYPGRVAHGAATSIRPKRTEVFWFFFSKKNPLPFIPRPPTPPPRQRYVRRPPG